mmetsp:Transcript_28406/g.40187  ORF Transcript_28406/g.40187 Transcript_28406/m.40187 type:complete len:310 (-) Transcript_28406:70-999(-)
MNEEDNRAPLTAVATPVPDEATVVKGAGGEQSVFIPAEYLTMPETKGLFWNDNFFDNSDPTMDGIVAVFDFDYEQMRRFKTQVAIINQACCFVSCSAYSYLAGGPIGIAGFSAIYGLTLTPCLLAKQIRWEVYASHVAITRDGIRFVKDKRKGCWGLSMCDKGKHSKTIPFDKITDCDIVEPAGNECLCIPRVLMVVNVDTASSGSENKRHELRISGLKEPHKFKALVWAMKRRAEGRNNNGSTYHAPQVMEMVERCAKDESMTPAQMKSEDASGISELLKDIRSELRENNDLLRKMKEENSNKSGGAN